MCSIKEGKGTPPVRQGPSATPSPFLLLVGIWACAHRHQMKLPGPGFELSLAALGLAASTLGYGAGPKQHCFRQERQAKMTRVTGEGRGVPVTWRYPVRVRFRRQGGDGGGVSCGGRGRPWSPGPVAS